MKKKKVVISVLVLLVALVLVVPLAAQDPVTDDDVNEIARELYCPVCENTPLDVCPTQACKDWRDLIRTKLGEGQTEQEIKDYFVTQYGPRVLAEPPRQGFDLVIWLLPVGAVLLGGLFFGRYLRDLKEEKEDQVTSTTATTASTPNNAEDYRTRLERELRED